MSARPNITEDAIRAILEEADALEVEKKNQSERLKLNDEANEIIFKAHAVMSALQYGRKEIDDGGETVDGVTWIVRDYLRRLNKIVDELGGFA